MARRSNLALISPYIAKIFPFISVLSYVVQQILKNNQTKGYIGMEWAEKIEYIISVLLSNIFPHYLFNYNSISF